MKPKHIASNFVVLERDHIFPFVYGRFDVLKVINNFCVSLRPTEYDNDWEDCVTRAKQRGHSRVGALILDFTGSPEDSYASLYNFLETVGIEFVTVSEESLPDNNSSLVLRLGDMEVYMRRVWDESTK